MGDIEFANIDNYRVKKLVISINFLKILSLTFAKYYKGELEKMPRFIRLSHFLSFLDNGFDVGITTFISIGFHGMNKKPRKVKNHCHNKFVSIAKSLRNNAITLAVSKDWKIVINHNYLKAQFVTIEPLILHCYFQVGFKNQGDKNNV